MEGLATKAWVDHEINRLEQTIDKLCKLFNALGNDEYIRQKDVQKLTDKVSLLERIAADDQSLTSVRISGLEIQLTAIRDQLKNLQIERDRACELSDEHLKDTHNMRCKLSAKETELALLKDERDTLRFTINQLKDKIANAANLLDAQP